LSGLWNFVHPAHPIAMQLLIVLSYIIRFDRIGYTMHKMH